jgi:hypothetical protein
MKAESRVADRGFGGDPKFDPAPGILGGKTHARDAAEAKTKKAPDGFRVRRLGSATHC